MDNKAVLVGSLVVALMVVAAIIGYGCSDRKPVVKEVPPVVVSAPVPVPATPVPPAAPVVVVEAPAPIIPLPPAVVKPQPDYDSVPFEKMAHEQAARNKARYDCLCDLFEKKVAADIKAGKISDVGNLLQSASCKQKTV